VEINKADLIFNRTQADADYALRLERESIHTDENLRGAYNSSDRNRVASAVNLLLEKLRNNGYGIIKSVKSDWKEGGIVRVKDNALIIARLVDISRVLPHISLEIPDNLDNLDWRKANAVEHILFDMLENYERLADVWLWCGEGYAGYDFEEHKLDDWRE
jgi:hypothetical protein